MIDRHHVAPPTAGRAQRARLAPRLVVLACLPTLLWACSLPADEGVTPIDADELPPALRDTTTTSTTTTTTTTTTVPTSEPDTTEATTTTTSTPPVPTTPVRLYYVDPVADGMLGLNRLLLGEQVVLDNVIGQLETLPPDLESFNVRSAVVPDLIAGWSLDRSVLTVSLSGAVFDSLSEDQKREAIAQMVLTFTSFTMPGSGNIGSVVLQIDGTPIPVFRPADGTTSEPGQPLYFADFATLIVGTSDGTPPTSSSPPSTPPGTQPSTPPST